MLLHSIPKTTTDSYENPEKIIGDPATLLNLPEATYQQSKEVSKSL